MPITEFAALHLIPPHSFHSGAPAEFFRILSIRQASYSAYPLYFFADRADPSMIYLITGWLDVDTHKHWIESDGNQELLKMIGPFLEVKSLHHLDIDFTEVPGDCEVVVVENLRDGEPNTHNDPSQAISLWKGIGEDLEQSSRPMYSISAFLGSDLGILDVSAGAIVMKRLTVVLN